MNQIEDNIDTSMAVAPPEDAGPGPGRQHDAGHDTSIEKRLQKNPESKEARLDRALDESMDASDPPASTQPVHNQGPAPSSGYDAEAERKLQEGR